MKPKTYHAGTMADALAEVKHDLGRDAVKYYKLPERGWMLEYARGPIFTMLPFGLADSVFSTLDLRALRQTISTYGSLCVKELLKGKI